MRKILFVGHHYHSSTGSSSFFQDLLRLEYELSIFHVDPHGDSEADRLASLSLEEYDCVLLWQIDYLASYFLRRGMPTIVCPMYDASSTLDAAHWRSMAGSLIFCFSLELHYRVQAAGVHSIYIRYFPNVYPLTPRNDSFSFTANSSQNPPLDATKNGLKVFFWERLPDSLLCLSTVIKLLEGIPVSHLHVHQAPDPGKAPTPIPSCENLHISTSTWFESKADYLQAIQEADIFIAPRFSEGIGLGFLEAMSYGCCVIAHDMATHNEYISNWQNGILVNFYSKEPIALVADEDHIRSLGIRAHQDSLIWKDNWSSFYSQLAIAEIESYILSANLVHAVSPFLPSGFRKMLAIDDDG